MMNKDVFLEKIINNIDPESKVSKALAKLESSDIKAFFFRNDESNSLSKRGLDILLSMFQSWELKLSEPLTSNQLLVLARNSTLPFFASDTRVVVFEREIGALMCMGNGGSVFDLMFSRDIEKKC
jgi:hypothetical protein